MWSRFDGSVNFRDVGWQPGPSQQITRYEQVCIYMYVHQGGSFSPITLGSLTIFTIMTKKQNTSTLTSILAGGLAGASETVVTVSPTSFFNLIYNFIDSLHSTQPNLSKPAANSKFLVKD